MKPSLKFAFLCISAFILLRCEKEVTSRDYPRLNTLEATEINASGATFSADIIFRGTSEILNYGFVWSESSLPELYHSDKFIFEGNTTASGFSAHISATFEAGVTYYVRSFIQTSTYIVYGNAVAFISVI